MEENKSREAIYVRKDNLQFYYKLIWLLTKSRHTKDFKNGTWYLLA